MGKVKCPKCKKKFDPLNDDIDYDPYLDGDYEAECPNCGCCMIVNCYDEEFPQPKRKWKIKEVFEEDEEE